MMDEESRAVKIRCPTTAVGMSMKYSVMAVAAPKASAIGTPMMSMMAKPPKRMRPVMIIPP